MTNLSEGDIKLLQQQLCPHFSIHDFTSITVITEPQFQKIIAIYYRVLKQHSEEGDQILEMTPVIITKLFISYATDPARGQLFREFVRCFSICTKSTLKDRIIAIVTAC